MKKVEELKIAIKNDFKEAQKILDAGQYTQHISAADVYNTRLHSDQFNRVFKVAIDRLEDYQRFLRMVQCENEDISFTFEEWKEGRLADGQRLGKFLRKNGVSQRLLDYYSRQVKEEKTVFLIISDRVQHVAGMSYYSDGCWDGMNGSSCQDTRHGGRYAISLAGALHDDKLYVAFIVEDIEDLDDMEGKMLARVVMRLIHVDDTACLVATRYYGNNETKDLLHMAIEQVEEEDVLPIFSRGVLYGDDVITERTNGAVEVEISKEFHIYRDDYIDIEVECPACDGWAEIDVTDDDGYEHSAMCPHCEGRGHIYIDHHVYIDEVVTVEDIEEVTPYAEDYEHYGDFIEISVCAEYIREKLKGLKKLEA